MFAVGHEPTETVAADAGDESGLRGGWFGNAHPNFGAPSVDARAHSELAAHRNCPVMHVHQPVAHSPFYLVRLEAPSVISQ